MHLACFTSYVMTFGVGLQDNACCSRSRFCCECVLLRSLSCNKCVCCSRRTFFCKSVSRECGSHKKQIWLRVWFALETTRKWLFSCVGMDFNWIVCLRQSLRQSVFGSKWFLSLLFVFASHFLIFFGFLLKLLQYALQRFDDFPDWPVLCWHWQPKMSCLPPPCRAASHTLLHWEHHISDHAGNCQASNALINYKHNVIIPCWSTLKFNHSPLFVWLGTNSHTRHHQRQQPPQSSTGRAHTHTHTYTHTDEINARENTQNDTSNPYGSSRTMRGQAMDNFKQHHSTWFILRNNQATTTHYNHTNSGIVQTSISATTKRHQSPTSTQTAEQHKHQ